MRRFALLAAVALGGCAASGGGGLGEPSERLRVIIETDAGGDPDDEQSLVRFLLYANEWDVEGIIANRPRARDRENLNPERTGLGIVRRLLQAYGQCHPNLVRHDPRYPSLERLWARAVPGYADTEEGVDLILAAVDAPDPRPVWFQNWGTDHGSSPSCLKRALDRVLRERGPEGYAAFKSRLRITGDDQFGDHTLKLEPPFKFWVDTLRPPLDGKRWYHRFSALTAKAGGFDIERDVRTGHGPLGALYPTNTTHPQKEGDTMMFLYLVPTGMNDPNEPTWGSWGGRYGPRDDAPGKPYYWANQKDEWRGITDRDQVLRRWAEDLQNDFRARLDWCVKEPSEANHPPEAAIHGPARRSARAGEVVTLDAGPSRDPDGNALSIRWAAYPEAGTYRGPMPHAAHARAAVTFTAPPVSEPRTLHFIASVTDDGSPPLTRYRRVIVTFEP